ITIVLPRTVSYIPGVTRRLPEGRGARCAVSRHESCLAHRQRIEGGRKVGDDNFGHLERLVSELDARGLLARVVRTQSGRLLVRVINANATSGSEDVACRMATDVPVWWYCWSGGERRHTVDGPAGAAGKVARVLPAVGACPGR